MQWFYIFPDWYQYTIIFIFGAVIGSFLNVYIYRFHTGKSLSGHSHCLSCGTRLRALELIPLLSYLGLRGRCRNCHSMITARYFLVELVTGVLFLCSYLTVFRLEELLYLWLVCAILVVITVYDIRHFIIPDSLTIALTTLATVWLLYEVYVGVSAFTDLFYTVLAAAAGSGFLFSLWFISNGRWIGFGDVKLAFPLGLIVGTWQVFSMIVLSFWIGAGVSILIIALMKLQRGKLRLRFILPNLTMKSVVPFAPFLVAGCLTVLFTKFNVLTLFTF